MSLTRPTVFILSVSSDIGFYLAEKFLQNGSDVIGTYRTLRPVNVRTRLQGCTLLPCDISKINEVRRLVKSVNMLKLRWSIFISCVGQLTPLTPFFDTEFGKWEKSFNVNGIFQLRVLHALYPFRDNTHPSHAVFIAGGGVSKTVKDFSAYTAGKVMLVKMSELIDAEEKNLDIFTVGPGWVKTKIHNQVLNASHLSNKYTETKQFLDSGKGTDLASIFQCIVNVCSLGKGITGGRNFSVVHDTINGTLKPAYKKSLSINTELFKLRRFENK
jgi:short-subunit dehydrogenase